MVRPLFIICSKSGSEDKETGLLSIFEVLEKVFVVKIAPQEGTNPPIILPSPSMRMIAAWMIESEKEEKYGEQFEYELRLVMPPNGSVLLLGGGTFSFAENRPVHRFTLQLAASLPFEGTGTMWVESCVRKPGKDWNIQSYPVLVEEIPAASPPSQPPPSVREPSATTNTGQPGDAASN